MRLAVRKIQIINLHLNNSETQNIVFTPNEYDIKYIEWGRVFRIHMGARFVISFSSTMETASTCCTMNKIVR